MNYKATIKRGEPTPSICKLCSSIYKHIGEISDTPEENTCFVKNDMSQYPEEMQKKMMEYQPFTNSKRKVLKTCKQFAHLKSYTVR